MLKIALLGGVEFENAGGPVKGFISAKAQALLCYLAVTRRPQRRDVLCGLLWAEKSDADARLSLRVALSNLHRLVPPHLAIARDAVEFNRESPYWLDLQSLESPVETRGDDPAPGTLEALREKAALYRGDFLAGFHVRDAPEFEEWTLGVRERYRRIALDALYRLAAHHSARREHEPAIAYTARLLELEPWQEEAHRQMMRLLGETGQISAALAQYETCRRVLREEFGLAPSAETEALRARLLAAR